MGPAEVPPVSPPGLGALDGRRTTTLARDSTSSGFSSEGLNVDEKLSRGTPRRKDETRRLFGLQRNGPNGTSPVPDPAASGSDLEPEIGNQEKHGSDRTAGASASTAAPSRAKTFWRAVHQLYKLPESEVDAFMDSYIIYGLDWKDEDAMRRTLGPDFQRRVGDCLRAYYGVLNHLCALGDVEKMYIPPLMERGLSVRGNQLRYEETVARDIALAPGHRVLDLGCGRGRVAAHMASLVGGARVTGLNIDPSQLAQARAWNDELGLRNDFVERDFNELPLPFADASFDGFYQIQALSLCRDPAALFRELHRVLRPGARVSLLDWVSLPAYDPADPEHAELMRRVKPLIGAVGTPTPRSLEDALRAAGFVVTRSDNASLDGLQAPLIDRVDVYFRSLRRLVLGLVRLRLLPPHLKRLIDRLCLDGQAFVKMDRMRLATTSYRIVAEKPLGPSPAQPEKEAGAVDGREPEKSAALAQEASS